MLVFHLKRFWPNSDPAQLGYPWVDLYEEIKAGRKTSEWRDNTPYWFNRLINTTKLPWRIAFVTGYPKHSLPRLEADLVNVVLHSEINQIEVEFRNAVEVKK